MKLSVFFDHVLEAEEQSGMPLQDVLSLCRMNGIEGLEISDRCLREREQELRELLPETGVQISCIYGSHDLTVPEGLAGAQAMLRLAERHGVRRVLLVPGALPEEQAAALNALCPEDTGAWMDANPGTLAMRNALRELVAEAHHHQTAVTLEDFDGPVQPYARAEQLRWFMTRVPGLKCTLDTGNFAYSDEDVLAGLALLGQWVAHVHCKDRGAEAGFEGCRFSRGLAPVAVGDGYLPVDAVVRRLKQQGYRGYLAVEHFGMADQMTAMVRSAKYLTGLIR